MEKEEILAKNRKDNAANDEYALHVLGKAGLIATVVGGIFCLAFTILEYFLTHHITFSHWAIYCAMLSCEFIVKAVKLHSRHAIVFSIFYGLISIGCTVLYVLRLLEVIG
ncbi:MAG: DUF6442 family protein [Clostridia bacterium]|nr:DUF6442 family protein [Clostridia bacterium]